MSRLYFEYECVSCLTEFSLPVTSRLYAEVMHPENSSDRLKVVKNVTCPRCQSGAWRLVKLPWD